MHCSAFFLRERGNLAAALQHVVHFGALQKELKGEVRRRARIPPPPAGKEERGVRLERGAAAPLELTLLQCKKGLERPFLHGVSGRRPRRAQRPRTSRMSRKDCSGVCPEVSMTASALLYIAVRLARMRFRSSIASWLPCMGR